MIIYVHIERSAGSSMHESFYPHFQGKGFVLVRRSFANDVVPVVEANGRDIYVYGHFGIREVLRSYVYQDGDTLLSAVRDPVDRLYSLYKLAHRSPEWLPMVAPSTVGRGFPYFADYCIETRQFAGNHQCDRIGGAPTLQAAVGMITSRYAVVGSYARIGKFVDAVGEAVSSTVPSWTYSGRKNEAPSEGLDEVDGYTAERIRVDSPDDCALCEWIETTCGGVYSRAQTSVSENVSPSK